MSELNNYHKLESLTAVERKEFEELKQFHSVESERKRERVVFFGYVAVALLSTLLISGALNFQDWESLIR
ncbi:MAG: hypothetical protein AAFN77_21485 [Planctomycetota bacterium]